MLLLLEKKHYNSVLPGSVPKGYLPSPPPNQPRPSCNLITTGGPTDVGGKVVCPFKERMFRLL